MADPIQMAWPKTLNVTELLRYLLLLADWACQHTCEQYLPRLKQIWEQVFWNSGHRIRLDEPLMDSARSFW